MSDIKENAENPSDEPKAAEAEAEAQSEAQSEAEAEPGAEAEAESGADAESEAEADPGAEADSGADADAEAEAAAAAEADAEADADPEPVAEVLLRPGNALRVSRGLTTFFSGFLVALFIMALRPQYRIGVPLGGLAILLATFGVLDFCGTFDDPDERVAKRVALQDLAEPLGVLLGSSLAFALAVSAAVSGYLGVIGAGVLVTTTFLGAVVGVYRTLDALGAWERGPAGEPLSLFQRHGFWLVFLVTLLYLPLLGSHSLSDPWETHYGEVSREILSRNDWVSLWWAQDGWFWSKPILDFWIQALAMATFGVRYQPGAMLSAVAEGRTPFPEWAVRLPIFLLTLVAIYLLYKACAKVFGRRAGFLGGLVLTTMPQWFLVTHQTMTDMPFVATMSAAMALFLLGAHELPEREAKVYEVKAFGAAFRFSFYHLVIGAIIAVAMPQIIYLLSRNIEIIPSPFSLRFHADIFRSGSPINCGLPGNEVCRDNLPPVVKGLQPALQAALWIQALGVLLYMSWGERRVQRLFFLAAWFFAALSTMAKGPAGFGLPVLCAFAYVLVSKRGRDLLRMEIVAGMLILLAVAMPWFVAMFARHGQPFTDRLLFHDMFKRAFTHVHDTNEGDDVGFRFYLWQLGYAIFPWTGLAPAALVAWLRHREDGEKKADASIFLAIWFVFGFALFSLMLTKFHHYILPALPPIAMLIGVLLDEMIERSPLLPKNLPNQTQRRALSAIYGFGLLAAVLGILEGFYRIRIDIVAATAIKSEAPKSLWLAGTTGLAIALAGGLALVATISLIGRKLYIVETPNDAANNDDNREHEKSFVRQYERLLFGAAGLAGGLIVFFVGRDLAGTREGLLDQVRLLHLFTYNYKRPFPTSLDFKPTLFAFAIVAALFTSALVIARTRRHIVAALATLSIVFCAWGLDSYFMKTSPHWGQRETFLAYQKANQEIPGPIMAFQMNWKGENFYNGNAIPAFVSSGKKFQDYILDQKKKGIKTFYFMTEHGRMGTLAAELGSPRIFDKLTTPELNNKFGLVRATFE